MPAKIVAIIDRKGLSVLVTNYKKYVAPIPFAYKFLFGSDNKYLFINSRSIISEEKDVSGDWDIILISDEVHPTDYPKDFFDSSTRVLYHKRPENVVEVLISDKGVTRDHCKKGGHVLGWHGYQYPLLNVLSTYDEHTNQFYGEKYSDALVNFLKWFGYDATLSDKLLILHNCLSVETFGKSLPERLSERQKVAFENFRNKYAGQLSDELILSEGYMNSLRQLSGDILQ